MKNTIINICLISIIILLAINNLYDLKEENKKHILINNYINDEIAHYDVFGYIQIDKINLKEILYKIDSPNNSLSKGLLLESINPLIILGHSGNGHLALFNDLDKLKINDIIIININRNITRYKIIQINTKQKSDKILTFGDLILVTCSKKDISKKIELVAEKI